MNRNQKIMDLWDKYYTEEYEFFKRIPLLVPDKFDKRNNLMLFIGLNPSYTENGVNSFINNSGFNLKEDDFIYKKGKNLDSNIIADLIKRRSISFNTYGLYFGKLRELSDSIGLCFEHIDLLYMDETKSKIIKDAKVKYPDFIKEQVKITIEIINEINPKIIFVNNKTASEIIKDNIKPEFDTDLGTYIYTLDNKKIPVFLSGLITSQRMIDEYSFERLKWHLKFVYQKLI
jgi:hypothetical protein